MRSAVYDAVAQQKRPCYKPHLIIFLCRWLVLSQPCLSCDALGFMNCELHRLLRTGLLHLSCFKVLHCNAHLIHLH